MIVKYNSLDKTETPILTLCNPGSTYNNGYLTNVVGILTDCEAEELVFNFNSPSELNFRINRVDREVSTENNSIKQLYDAVKNRRLIFIDGIGYFSITNIEDNYQDGIAYKDVKAQSIEVELQQKQIPYIEDGTYRFLTDGNETTIGLFNRIVEVLPLWTIGHIDETLKGKWRTFEDVDVTLNCLGFLIDSMQEAYECIFLFDIINRQINIYEQSNYVRRTGIQITKDDIIKSLNITENADDLYTAISVQGSDDLSISAINPLGGSVIYNFHYYLSWMSSALRTKVTQWQMAVDNAKSTYYQNNLNYFNKLQEVSNLQAEINQLDGQITMYTRCKDSIIANSNTSFVDEYNTEVVRYGGEEIVVYADVADTVTALIQQISGCEAEKTQTQSSLTIAQGQLNSYLAQNQTINNQLSITSYFTQSEYEELANYIFEGSYTDDYIKVTDIMTYSEKFQQMKTLYDRAEAQLLKVSEPTQEFDVDSESVIFDSNFSHWNNQIETGCLINVELVKNDWAWLFLSTITVNYDDKNLKFTFGNRFNKYDTKSLFDKVLGSITKSANTLQYIKDVLYPIKDGTFDDMKEAIQSSRNITMAGALASNNEEVVIDSSGYTGRTKLANGTYDPQQIKITGKNIVFTDDAWDTANTAIGEILLPNDVSTYGINAETVIGELLVGERVVLQNPEQSLRFDEDGLTVFNDTNSFILNPSGDTLISIKKGNHEIFGLDQNGALHVEADGTGIDLSSNDSILGLNASIQATAKEIKSTVSSAVSKYDTSEFTIHLYGYGSPANNYDAANYNTLYYLDQSNGYLYQSDGTNWIYKSRLSLITDNLQSQISITEREIKSTVGRAVSKYDTTGKTVNLYGYGTPASMSYDASEYNGQYYLNQSNGYLYKSNGSGWIYQEHLTLITSNLQTQITQNATDITSKVDSGDFGTLITQNASNVKIAWNNISQYIQFEDYNNKASFGIYDNTNASTKKIRLRLSPEGLSIYNGATTNNLIMKLDTVGMRIYDGNGTSSSNLKMNLTTTGIWYYHDGTNLGKIGTNGFSGTNYKGIVFDLNYDASYMSWAYQESADATYSQKWTYWGNNNNPSMADADTLNAGCPIDMHSFQIRNATFNSWKYIGSNDSVAWNGVTGTWSGVYPKTLDSNGAVLTYGNFSLTFQNGILKSASW